MKKYKFACFSLGCKVNQAEIEKITRDLTLHGFLNATSGEKADICIVNTCTVTATAEQKSRQKIRKIIKEHPGAFIIITGCYAEDKKEVIKKNPGVSLVLENKDKSSIPNIIKDKFHCREKKENFQMKFLPEGRTRAFLKIQDGCDSFCSYCIIPFVRGKPVSTLPEKIIDEAKKLCSAGYKEIVITGINLGLYGRDLTPKLTLSELLERVIERTPVKRIRISSLEPPVDMEILNLIKNYSHFCPHLHIHLQHGHNKILKDMNRNYTVEEFTETVIMAKSKIQNLSITTDVMVGFPGERDEHFMATRDLIEKLEFARLHVFSYSPRERTKAPEIPFKIDEKIKKERSKILLETGKKLTEKFYKKFINHTLPVLVEHREDKKTGLLKGLTDNYIPVITRGDKKYEGEIVMVKLLELKDDSVLGQIVELE